MSINWIISIDWDRNNNYTDTYDNVTARVISAQWSLGIETAYEEVADNSVLRLVLKNDDKLYSPENGASALAGKIVPQRPVQIQAFDTVGVLYTHWVGWIDSIQPIVGRYGERTVQIIAVGAMQFLKAAETHLPLQQNKRTDEVIAELINEVVVPPSLAWSWVLGRVGNSELDVSTYLVDTTLYSALDTGALTLKTAADNWVRQGGFSDVLQNNFDVYHAISDITAAEHGKFFFNRYGSAVFWNRQHLLQGATSAATFNDTGRRNESSMRYARSSPATWRMRRCQASQRIAGSPPRTTPHSKPRT